MGLIGGSGEDLRRSIVRNKAELIGEGRTANGLLADLELPVIVF